MSNVAETQNLCYGYHFQTLNVFWFIKSYHLYELCFYVTGYCLYSLVEQKFVSNVKVYQFKLRADSELPVNIILK